MANFDHIRIGSVEEDRLIPVMPFDTFVLSFCADTPKGTSVEVQARVRLAGGELSGWFSWGLWSPFIDRHSINSADDLAALDTDTLTVKGGRLADGVQVRALLNANAEGQTPVLHSVHLAVKNTQAACDEPLRAHRDAYAPTPCYSQMVRAPRIGGVICSATTIAMLLASKGENMLPEEIALHNYDSAYQGCGNWCFSTAIAAAYGYEAYVRYATLDDELEELENGNAVGASVSYSNDPNHERLPYVENAPCNTPGHLLVLCGFETDAQGKQFAIVHDPAAKENAAVERRYPLEQFLKAWSNRLIYVVHGPRREGPRFIPERVNASLAPAEGEDNFRLLVQGQPVRLSDGRFDAAVGWITARRGGSDAECGFAYGEVTPEGLLHLPGYDGQPLYAVGNRGTTCTVNLQ